MKKTTNDKKEDKSPYVHQKTKINYDLNIKELPWTKKQKELIDLIENKNSRLILIKGPAGSSKSIVSIYCGLQALKSKKNSHIVYSRPILESADSGSKLGFLPGSLEDKISPYTRVIDEKLEELLPAEQIMRLKKENRIEFTEVNYLRGASMNAIFMIIDEAQGYVLSELITLITRIGKYSKVIICADPDQSDLPINKQGAFDKIKNLFQEKEAKEHGIYSFEFTEEDIMRSDLCKYIVGKMKELKNNKSFVQKEFNLDGSWQPKSSQ